MSTFEVYVVLLRIIEMILRQKKKLSNVLSSLNLTIAISIHYDDQSKYYAFLTLTSILSISMALTISAIRSSCNFLSNSIVYLP